MKPHNIGIALSGGGIRAAVFHLGVFKWMAENDLLEEVKCVSTVSGASLCVGLIYSYNNFEWPSSRRFLTTVLPAVEKVLLSSDLQRSAMIKLIVSPAYWNKKVNIVAKSLENHWGVHGRLSDLSGAVTWYINCTTFESGKRFYFSREKMCDYTIGCVKNPRIPLADVMAASAGFPIFIGPYSLKTGNFQWAPHEFSGPDWRPPSKKTLHLWDGGVYDNLGLESIFQFDNCGGLKDGLEFVIICNASASIDFLRRQWGFSVRNLKRILDISMDQVAALRTRAVMDFIRRTGQGIYVKIGNSAEKILLKSGCPKDFREQTIKKCLSEEQADQAMNYPTTLEKPELWAYQLLLRHGYETADCTYRCHQKNFK